MKHKHVLLFVFTLLWLFSSCAPEKQLRREWDTKIQSIQKALVPDRSLEVFDVQLNRQGSRWLVQGQTTIPAAKEAVLHLADSLFGQAAYRERLRLLPDSALGDSIYGIVNIAVAPLRRTPSRKSEMIDETLMGSALKILEQKEEWYRIQTEYRYLGWIKKTALWKTNLAGREHWINGNLVRVKAFFTQVHEKPNEQSQPLYNALFNARLRLLKKGRTWSNVMLPGMGQGYIKTTEIAPFNKRVNLTISDASSLVQTALQFMGVPYLWGGNSAAGNDCSGFTQNVFFANGLLLPRDARQQALVGKEIVPEPDFSNVRPGDLLFFGSKKSITHVGLSLGGSDFIHQDSRVNRVRINSFDSTSTRYSYYRKHTLKKITRLLNSEE